MRNASVVRVAVERTSFHYDKPYDYLLPADMAQTAKPGCRVMVPFGTGNRKRQAVILSVTESSDYEKLKPIVSVLDNEPVLSGEMLALAQWMKEHTFCSYFDAFKPMLPAGINLRIVTSYMISPEYEEQLPDGIGGDEKLIAEYLQQSKAMVEKERLLDIMQLPSDSTLPDEMCEKGILTRNFDTVRKIGDATVKMLKLSDDYASLTYTQKQKSVIETLEQVQTASVKEICYFTGVTAAVINALAKKNAVEIFDNIVYRSAVDQNRQGQFKDIVLSDEQQAVYEGLKKQYSSPYGGAGLLYGVTGSGKTQVFLKLVDDAYNDGKDIIVMVPEISLTPQTLSLFYDRYGGKVAVFHSAMSLGQRMDEWRRVKSGDARVVIGTRSAVFAPFSNLGLVIMDEEQEGTYKSESSPRYHARDVARFRCNYNNALLVLSSATPSVESFCAARDGRYEMYRLSNRYGNSILPDVLTVDMNSELINGNTSSFSAVLQEKLRENLDNGKQSILLLNRRGHNTFVSCSSCGHVVTCPNCSISLTYHSANKRLMCHYCGYSEPLAQKCPECGSEHMRYSGIGTQRAEQELEALFPSARILRMDADSTLARNSYEEKLGKFAAGEYDIMLGTQMVAKGLDFPRVTLVGVLNADAALYGEDYRSFERTFSLLTQVVGRSGRGEDKGIAIIQTVTPENGIIHLAAQQDYDKFFEQEILTRKAMIYPPFCSLCEIGFVGTSAESVKECAQHFTTNLQQLNQTGYADVKLIVLGPSAASVPKVSNKYRYRVLIKTRNNKQFRQMISELLIMTGKTYDSKKVSVFADINPESIL